MKSKKGVKIFKVIVAIMVLIIFIVATIYLFPIILNLKNEDARIAFKDTIQDSGISGFLMLMGLELAQIFIAILPGEPLEILAGMCYGSVWGTAFILLASFISSVAIFFAVRKFGKDFVYEFCAKEKVDKIENSALFNNADKIEKIMFILFFIPGLPKDIFVYIGGLLPVKPVKFIAIATFARIPSIISSTIAGAYLIKGSWKIAIISYAVIVGVAGILLLLYNVFNKKDKDTKEIINTLK